MVTGCGDHCGVCRSFLHRNEEWEMAKLPCCRCENLAGEKVWRPS